MRIDDKKNTIIQKNLMTNNGVTEKYIREADAPEYNSNRRTQEETQETNLGASTDIQ